MSTKTFVWASHTNYSSHTSFVKEKKPVNIMCDFSKAIQVISLKYVARKRKLPVIIKSKRRVYSGAWINMWFSHLNVWSLLAKIVYFTCNITSGSFKLKEHWVCLVGCRSPPYFTCRHTLHALEHFFKYYFVCITWLPSLY